MFKKKFRAVFLVFYVSSSIKKDLHIQEIKKIVERDHAVSIEIFNDQEVLGSSYLTNFSSEL
ncbi:hypothetical protein ACF5W4_05880 [Bacillota bacterium Lsc_1132]